MEKKLNFICFAMILDFNVTTIMSLSLKRNYKKTKKKRLEL